MQYRTARRPPINSGGTHRCPEESSEKEICWRRLVEDTGFSFDYQRNQHSRGVRGRLTYCAWAGLPSPGSMRTSPRKDSIPHESPGITQRKATGMVFRLRACARPVGGAGGVCAIWHTRASRSDLPTLPCSRRRWRASNAMRTPLRKFPAYSAITRPARRL